MDRRQRRGRLGVPGRSGGRDDVGDHREVGHAMWCRRLASPTDLEQGDRDGVVPRTRSSPRVWVGKVSELLERHRQVAVRQLDRLALLAVERPVEDPGLPGPVRISEPRTPLGPAGRRLEEVLDQLGAIDARETNGAAASARGPPGRTSFRHEPLAVLGGNASRSSGMPGALNRTRMRAMGGRRGRPRACSVAAAEAVRYSFATIWNGSPGLVKVSPEGVRPGSPVDRSERRSARPASAGGPVPTRTRRAGTESRSRG